MSNMGKKKSLKTSKQKSSHNSKISLDQLFREFEQAEKQGQFRKSLAIGREIVSRKPGISHGHYAMGSAFCNLGLLDDADTALKKAIARDPQAGIYTRHAEVLNRLGHHELAIEAINTAISKSPDDPRILVVQAMVLGLGGSVDQAYANLDRAIEGGCTDPNLRSVHASLGGQLGRIEQGIAELEALVKEAEDKVWVDPFMHSAILMHLSKLYDRSSRYEEAFEAATRGGAMRKTGYDPEKSEATCDDLIRVWSQETVDGLACSRVSSEKLVFILGMPRSGTSLIEQIIASHPLGYGGGELAELYMAAKELSEPTSLQPDRMDVVSGIQRAGLDRCGRKILKSMEKAAGKNEDGVVYERITDKLPSNYEFVGMIGLLFPNAKIIHARRNALDNCISCYLLDFVGDVNHGYSYNLEHLAHQYKLYQRAMEHWRKVSPIEMLEVDYEELVAHPEEGSRQIIEYVGLEWDDRCAKSHETKRAVSTLSSEQVRKPMYTSAVGRWKNYEDWIGGLIGELGDGE